MKPTVVAPEKYEEKQPMPEVVTIPMMSPTVPRMIESRPKWKWCHFVMSLFASLFCLIPGMLCGITGLYHSILSYVDHKTGDFPRATRKRRCAYGCTITAIVLGAICWALIIAGTVMYWRTFAGTVMYWRHFHQMEEMKHFELGKFGQLRKDYHKWNLDNDLVKNPGLVKNPDKPMFGGDDHDMKDHDDSKSDDDDDRHHHDRHHHDRHHDGHDGDHKYPRPPRPEPMPA